MLNTKLVGSYISSLRKENDLTQVELADKVNVSHQAVSKWERGESLPDIETLLELGKLFGTSVDYLLSGGKQNQNFKNVGTFVKQISENQLEKAADLINQGKAGTDGFVSISPLLKTNTIKKITGKLEDETLTLEHLVELAPFLDHPSLGDLLAKVDTDHISKEQIISIAPFIDPKTLNHYVHRHMHALNKKEIISIAPFLDGKLDQLVLKMDVTDLDMGDINALAPFISSDTLVVLIEKVTDEPLTLEQIIEVAPFLGNHADRFIQQDTIEHVTWNELKAIAPFIQKDTLAALLNKAPVENVPVRSLMELAPFLADHLEPLLEKVDVNELTPDVLVEIAPFVRKETLKNLMEDITIDD